MSNAEIETFYPENKQQWREWLQANHATKTSVWLIFCKKDSGMPTLSWSDSVDEALCFGWIDSVKKKLDEQRSIQFFSPRKPSSTWSKINKDKVQRLIDANLMSQAGLHCIDIAKQNGTWTILDEVEALIIPIDLEAAFSTKPGAKDYFISLSKTIKKMMLQWIVLAKQAETRQKRINEIAEMASIGKKPKQF